MLDDLSIRKTYAISGPTYYASCPYKERDFIYAGESSEIGVINSSYNPIHSKISLEKSVDFLSCSSTPNQDVFLGGVNTLIYIGSDDSFFQKELDNQIVTTIFSDEKYLAIGTSSGFFSAVQTGPKIDEILEKLISTL